MFPKSRLALIGLGVSAVIAAAWLARSLNAPARVQSLASVPAAAAPAVPSASAAPQPVPAAPSESSAVATRPGAVASAPTSARPLVFGESGPVRWEDVPAGRFRESLARLDPVARDRALAKLGELRVPLHDVASLHVDRRGHLFYACELPEQRSSTAREGDIARTRAAVGAPQAAAVPVATPPIRHSKPGSASVIYLDFNGHTVTATYWNEEDGTPGEEDYIPARASYPARPYSTDEDYANFSDSEQADIIEVWSRVAEDFAPFDVDVTTEAPASLNPRSIHVLITGKKDETGFYLPRAENAGGISFLDVYGYSNFDSFSPVFVYYAPGYTPAYLAGNASHEAGHYLSLSHDGTTSEEYYDGHSGGGVPSWGPIMGTTYDREMGQWSKGEYYQSNNPEDDIGIMAGKLGLKSDDHANDNGGATALAASGSNLSASGLIRRSDDQDSFSFTTAGGSISFTVTSFLSGTQTTGSNLDVGLDLYNSAGALVASADAPNTPVGTLTTSVGPGQFFLRVKGVGAGNPTSASPSGYSNYGSLGEYTLVGSAPPLTIPVFTAQPNSLVRDVGDSAYFSATAVGGAVSYRWQRLPAGSGTWQDLADGGGFSGTATTGMSVYNVTFAMNNDQYRLVATNGSGSATSSPATLTVNPAVAPGFSAQPQNVATAEDEWVSFTINATGTSPVTYQWQYLPPGAGVWSNVPSTGPWSGTTTFSMSLYAPLSMNGTQFRCIVTNQVGSATSTPATLTVVPETMPVITGLPASITVGYQQILQLTPTVTGSPTLHFQWTRNGSDISGEFHQNFGPWPADSSMTGDYVLRVTNTWGTVYSSHVQVTVTGDPNEVPPRPAFFNAGGYHANNLDVYVGYLPNWEDFFWSHYWRYGIAEGRTDGDFDVRAYLAQYPDLAAIFGTNLRAAALHWYTTGRAQGLRIPTGFDVLGYLARNADIAALFSQDKYGAWLHYYNYGLFEGRSFDANFIPAEYLELNQDLKVAFGSNWQAAVMHWFNYGHPIEDRMGRVPIGFNVDSYLARYPDLSAVFAGITPTAVRNVTVWHHYLAYGTLEGRSDGDFEAYHYLATNPDLNAIFGSDIQAAALHWYFYGRREGRRIPGGFTVQNYRALYPDVVLVFGDDLYGSWIHYRDNGVFEGRIYDDLFRPADYLSLNPDVAAAIGTNYRDALLHWLYYGQYEGRDAKN